ncbi:MAG: hypothetical protein WA944_15415, partial [Mycobacterium sp.]
MIRIVCPAVKPAMSNNDCHAVSPVTGSAAASTNATEFGAAASTPAGASTYSAAAPSASSGS